MKNLFIALSLVALVSAPSAFAGGTKVCNKDKAAACDKSKKACDKTVALGEGKSECKKACSQSVSKKVALNTKR